jgi:hypothetical protein
MLLDSHGADVLLAQRHVTAEAKPDDNAAACSKEDVPLARGPLADPDDVPPAQHRLAEPRVMQPDDDGDATCCDPRPECRAA